MSSAVFPPGAALPVLQTILVVDDEVLIRLVIAEYLRDCGYKVHEAAHADEAMAVLEHPGIAVDVVLTDVHMPAGSLDGFGLARWVRAHHPGVKVILTSGAARSAQIAGELCEHGPILAKPYEPAAALDRIKRLLASGRAATPAPPLGLAGLAVARAGVERSIHA